MNSFTNYTTPSGVIIERKPVVRDLGVLLSDDFTWRPHISNMVKNTRKMASWTLGVFRDRSKPVMLQLYKSLIRSRLEYCCPLQSLQRRRERYIIIHTWKIIMDIVPNDIGMKFVDNKRLGTRAVVPAFNRISTMKAKTYYDNSFGVNAAQLWNLLPAEAKTFHSLDKFKISLSKFLSDIPDLPPVTGYSTGNRNSLLDRSNQS